MSVDVEQASIPEPTPAGSQVDGDIRALFDLLDRNKDGDITKREMILTIRKARKTNDLALLQQLEKTLGMPKNIKQEDGLEQFELVFQDMDGMLLFVFLPYFS